MSPRILQSHAALLIVIRETMPDAPYMTPWSVAGAAIFVGVVVVSTLVVGRFATDAR